MSARPPLRGEELTLRDYRALAHFRHLLRRFLQFSERAARSAGLHPHQHQLLLAAKGVPEGELATIGVLARMLQLRHHSTVELVNRLAERRLVTRIQSASDRRCMIVRITLRGERILRKLSVMHRRELRTARVGLIRALTSLFGEPESLRLSAAPTARRRRG